MAENCGDYFTCNESKSLEQAIRDMIYKDSNDCPILRVKIDATESAPNSEVLGTPQFVSGGINGTAAATALGSALAALNKKVFNVIPHTSNDGTNGFIIIPYA